MTATLETARFRVISGDERRVEGRAKVTGAAQYSADFARPGMLWAAFVVSPVAHARIVAVEVDAARAMPGVHAVLTGADVAGHYFGRALYDWPVLAHERVRFVGEYVAAVAAESREAAEAAAAAIDVRYEELPGLFDPEAALAPGAPAVHETRSGYPFAYGKPPEFDHPNIQGRVTMDKGDLAAGFAGAVRTFEHRFTTPRHLGGYLEPRATLVWIESDGTLRVVSTNKSPFALRGQLASATGLPAASIVVEQAYIGGDFGAKGLSVDEFVCYFLAKATQRPVKAVRSYLDDIRSTNVRHASIVTVKSGVDANGKLVALDMNVLYDGGAYAAGKPIPTLIPGTPPKTPYNVPNAHVAITAVYTNNIPGGHVRAPGDVQIQFALESHIDMVAHELGIDPLEFRARNVIVGDETDLDGTSYLEPRARELLAILRREGRWDEPLPPGRGRGIALSVRHIGHGMAKIKIALDARGTIRVRSVMADQGVGALTVFQRLLAESLGVALERITVERETTATGLLDLGPGASRVTHVTGQAVLDGARQLREALVAAGWNETEATFERAAAAVAKDGPLEIVGSFDGNPPPGTPEAHNFSAFLADVSVDPETGAVTVNEMIFAVDIGTVINPVAHRGQIEGGFVFGYGHAMMEELLVEDGRIVNPSFADYKLPTERDVPPLRVIELPTPGGPGPYGAKMAGEVSTSHVAPALANAVFAACGARLMEMPITAERIYAALNR